MGFATIQVMPAGPSVRQQSFASAEFHNATISKVICAFAVLSSPRVRYFLTANADHPARTPRSSASRTGSLSSPFWPCSSPAAKSSSRTRASTGAKPATSGTTPLFKIPIPASRDTVPTGYNYVLPDQNGWSRYLHFEAAWVSCSPASSTSSRACSTATSAQSAPRARRAQLARLPRSHSPNISAARRPIRRNTRLQRRAAHRLLVVIFVLFPAHHLDRPRPVARLRLRLPATSTCSAAASPRARCTSSSPIFSCSSSSSMSP